MSNLSKETYARRRLILKWRRFLGLCSNCGAEAYGNSKCDRCQDRATERQKALRAKRKEKNLCRSCGKVEVKAGQWRCDACAIKKYGAKTCCTDGCNNAVLRGKRLCDECIELREAERQVCNVYFIACPDCNKLFTAKHRGHLRCDACQAIRTHRLNTEHRIERDGLTLHKKICVCCGEEFTTYKSNQKTCNPLCSKRMTKRNENHRRRAARYGEDILKRLI